MAGRTRSKTRRNTLLDAEDVLRSVQQRLNQLLAEGESLPVEVREYLQRARDAAWQRFCQQEEAKNLEASGRS